MQHQKKLIIADPSFEDWVGHHAPYDISIIETARSDGFVVKIWASKTLGSLFTDYEYNIDRVYSTSAWGKKYISRETNLWAIKLVKIIIYVPYNLYMKVQKTVKLLFSYIDFIKELMRLIIPPLVFDGFRKPILYARFFVPPIIIDLFKRCIPPFIQGLFSHPLWWVLQLVPPLLQDLIKILLFNRKRVYPQVFNFFLLGKSTLQYQETIWAIKKNKLQRGDVLYSHMITKYNFLAWAMIALYCKSQNINIKLLFRYPVEMIASSANDIRIAQKIFEECASDGLVQYYTDSEMLSKQYRNFLNSPVRTLPIPHLPEISMLMNDLDAPIRIAVLGNARSEKGFCEIVDSLEILQKKHSCGFEFHIQINNPDDLSSRYIQKLENFNSIKVVLYPNALNELEYKRLLQDSHVILAPYHAHVYQARTSGVVVEAIAAGKIIIVTKKTWLSEQLERYGSGLSVESYSPESIVEALLKIKNRFSLFIDDAARKAELYRIHHGPRAFLSCLLGESRSDLRKLRHAVIIFPFSDFFEQKSGAANRVGLLCKYLLANGIDVTAVIPKQTIREIPSKLVGLEVYEYIFRDSLTSYFNFIKIKIARFLGNYRYIWYINQFDKNLDNLYFSRALNSAIQPGSLIFVEYPFDLTSIKKITNTYKNRIIITFYDLMSLYKKNEKMASKCFELEIMASQYCDQVFTVSRIDSEFLLSVGIDNKPIHNPCEITYDNKIFKFRAPDGFSVNGKYIFFVGSMHEPNVYAANILREIASKLCFSDIRINLVIAGSCYSKIIDNNFISLGPVSDKLLHYLYKNCDMFVSPLHDGTGSSVKIVQALSYGKIILGTNDSFRGLNAVNLENCIIEDNIDNYPSIITRILKNYEDYRYLESNAFQYAEKFDYRKIFQPYLEEFNYQN